MKYISNNITSEDFINNKTTYDLPHVDFSNNTRTIFYKNTKDSEYVAYNKSDDLEGCILLNPSNITYPSEIYIDSYLTFSLNVDKIYIDGTKETSIPITLLMYVNSDTELSSIFKYKGLEIPYTISIKQPENNLSYTIDNNIITFTLNELSYSCLKALEQGQLYLVVENDSLRNTSGPNGALDTGRNKHRNKVKNTRLKFRQESWSSNVDKTHLTNLNIVKIKKVGQSGTFTINSNFVNLCIGCANSFALYRWNDYDSSRDYHMEYKFVLYCNIGDGRFKHINAEHFIVYNMFKSNRTIEKVE